MQEKSKTEAAEPTQQPDIDLTAINSYDQILSWLTNLEASYYPLLKLREIGRSAENRSLLIVEVRIFNGKTRFFVPTKAGRPLTL